MMPDDPDMLAGELALGVLEGEERAAALRRVLADPAFAREVQWWRTRLSGLFAEFQDVSPGPTADRRVSSVPGGTVRPVGRLAWAAAASTAVAAVLLLVLLVRPNSTPVSPPRVVQAVPTLVAVVDPEKGAPFGAVFNAATSEVRFSGGVAVPPGRDAELWAIGEDGVPKAIGLLRQGRLIVPADVVLRAGTTLAISIEPVGGSSRPTPTGPVVATGRLAAI